MKTASYAVMLTDIQGFTERMSQQTRKENERLVRIHDNLVSPVLRGYRGRRVKTIGDSYLVVFDSATRAIACGAAIQDRLALYNEQVGEGERLHLRVAVTAGELRIEGRDVFGEAVNLAARVEGEAQAGEVWFTEAALLLADASTFEYEEMGRRTFKGIPREVQLYRIRRAGGGLPYGGEALELLRLPAPTPERLGRRRVVPRLLLPGITLLVLLLVGALLMGRFVAATGSEVQTNTAGPFGGPGWQERER